MRPYLNELKVLKKYIETSVIEELTIPFEKIKLQYDRDSNCLAILSQIVLPANSEIVIMIGVKKLLIPFEEYTNDPNRGFDV